MAFDMESEFYKLAKRILANPKSLYKMLAIDPHSGRMAIMGSGGAMVTGRSMVRYFVEGPEKRAYRYGKAAGKDLFGGILNEFDEEIKGIDAKKVFTLGLVFAESLGWGSFKVAKFNRKRSTVEITGKDTIELELGIGEHHGLTCGYLAGTCSEAFDRKIKVSVRESRDGEVVFTARPLKGQ